MSTYNISKEQAKKLFREFETLNSTPIKSPSSEKYKKIMEEKVQGPSYDIAYYEAYNYYVI